MCDQEAEYRHGFGGERPSNHHLHLYACFLVALQDSLHNHSDT